MISNHFLSDKSRLVGANAVAAIIVSEKNRYLLQLRDDIPGIFYPGHWGCFGGALAPGELPVQCLLRELHEELEFFAERYREFIRFDFDLTKISQQKLFRAYYEVTVTEDLVSQFVLHEGSQLRLFTPLEIFSQPNISPYDSFALWIHTAKDRLR